MAEPEDDRDPPTASADTTASNAQEAESTARTRERSGISFSLPPIRLPPLFPDHLEIRLPVPGVRFGRRLSSGWVLLVALGFDAVDAFLAVSGLGAVDPVRTVGGLLIAVTLSRAVGLLYLWEVAAVLVGAGLATMWPTLGTVVVVWLWQADGENS